MFSRSIRNIGQSNPIQYSFIKKTTQRTSEKGTINMNDEMIKYNKVKKNERVRDIVNTLSVNTSAKFQSLEVKLCHDDDV